MRLYKRESKMRYGLDIVGSSSSPWHRPQLTSYDVFDEDEAASMAVPKEEQQPYLKVEQRRTDMEKFRNMSGVVATKESFEEDIINKITKKVVEMFYPKLVTREKHNNLVGRSFQMAEMKVHLDFESDEVGCVAIVGMGGIGKTAIAEVLYDQISPKFKNNSCFLPIISGQHVVTLQQKLLSRLVWKENVGIRNEYQGAKLIKNCLSSRKVLIVLDGVNEEGVLGKLAGSLDWFGSGSRIIITTRNRKVLRETNYKEKIQEYNVALLNHDNAFSLLCKHAFQNDPPDQNFMCLIEEMVKKVEGLPLALIELGSSLHGKGINVWKEKLKSFHKLVYETLFSDILKTSYEGFDEETQQIFLDLACFFKGMSVDRVNEILMALGYNSPHDKIHLLVDQCLIEILDDNIQMHTLITSMGQGIARGEISTKQDKQSRIWLQEDIRRVFEQKKGLKYIQGIVMDLEEKEELVLEASLFQFLTELKILEINNVQVSQDIEFLSSQLRLLNWPGYPSNCLPSTFQPSFLLELQLSDSNIVSLWEGPKTFIWLKEIDASESEYLEETPDFSNVPNLQKLIFRNCSRLSLVHSSINDLNRLILLDLEGCTSLKAFPSNMISIKSLETLILSNSGLECFPEIKGCMKSLTELHLDGTVINDLHLSIGHLSGLALLNLRNCTQLSSLPGQIDSLRSMKSLSLNGCKNLTQIPLSLRKMESLEELDIGETRISDAPHAIRSLCNLKVLNCEGLQRKIWHSLNTLFAGVFSIRDLNLSGCNLLDEDIPDDLRSLFFLEILDLSANHFVRLSESFTQLQNLKALYLNDCINLQQLPELPKGLQYLGGRKTLRMLLQNHEDLSTSTSSSLMTEVDNLSKEIAEKEGK